MRKKLLLIVIIFILYSGCKSQGYNCSSWSEEFNFFLNIDQKIVENENNLEAQASYIKKMDQLSSSCPELNKLYKECKNAYHGLIETNKTKKEWESLEKEMDQYLIKSLNNNNDIELARSRLIEGKSYDEIGNSMKVSRGEAEKIVMKILKQVGVEYISNWFNRQKALYGKMKRASIVVEDYLPKCEKMRISLVNKLKNNRVEK